MTPTASSLNVPPPFRLRTRGYPPRPGPFAAHLTCAGWRAQGARALSARKARGRGNPTHPPWYPSSATHPPRTANRTRPGDTKNREARRSGPLKPAQMSSIPPDR